MPAVTQGLACPLMPPSPLQLRYVSSSYDMLFPFTMGRATAVPVTRFRPPQESATKIDSFSTNYDNIVNYGLFCTGN